MKKKTIQSGRFTNHSTVSLDKTSVSYSNGNALKHSVTYFSETGNEDSSFLPSISGRDGYQHKKLLEDHLLLPTTSLALRRSNMETVRRGLTGIVQTSLSPILPPKPDLKPSSTQSEPVSINSSKDDIDSLMAKRREEIEKALSLKSDLKLKTTSSLPLSLAEQNLELLKSMSNVHRNVSATVTLSESSSRTVSSSYSRQEVSVRTSSHYLKDSVKTEQSSVVKSSYFASDSNVSLLRKLSMRKDPGLAKVLEKLMLYFEGPLYQNFFSEVESRGGGVSTLWNRPSISSSTSPPEIETKLQSHHEFDENKKNRQLVESPTSPNSLNKNVLSDLVENPCQRKLWSQTSQVISSGCLDKLSSKERILQECKFEIITSEVSYYRSLLILETHFAHSFAKLLSQVQFKYIFGHVKSVRRVSESVLRSIAKCFEEDIMMARMPQSIHELVKKHFHVLAQFCKNEKLMSKTVLEVRENEKFVELLNELESDPITQNLKLQSFLLLPFQRFLRMPLLVESVLKNTDPQDSEYQAWSDLHNYLKKEADDCNKACLELDLIAQNYVLMSELAESLHFPSQIPPLALISSNRHLELQDKFNGMQTDLIVGAIPSTVKLILFNDYLIVADCRSEKELNVLSYCSREKASMVEGSKNGGPVLKLSLTPDYNNKLEVWILGFTSEEDDYDKMKHWLEALTFQESDYWSSDSDSEIFLSKEIGNGLSKKRTDDKVEAVYQFEPNKTDELELKPGDKLSVRYTSDDGWCFGERLKDGQTGWFPGNFTTLESNQQ